MFGWRHPICGKQVVRVLGIGLYAGLLSAFVVSSFQR
jgi:hypothetical protein